MNTLSERLSLIASLIPKGVSVCDVGTDHGYLPAALYLSGGFSAVTATDVCEKPIKNAQRNLKKLGAQGVRLICCDGLSQVERKAADYVVIAGMGGDVISGIIDRCPYKNEITFILQPMTNAKALRVYLNGNGFDISYETAIKENNKLYSVMVCSFKGQVPYLNEAQKLIGSIKNDSAVNREYIEKQYNICKKCADAIKNIPEKEEEFSEHSKAIIILEKLLEA